MLCVHDIIMIFSKQNAVFADRNYIFIVSFS